MTQISIALPEILKAYVEAQVAEQGYASIDEYFLKLVQRDQQQSAQAKLDTLLQEGLNDLEQGDVIRTTDEWWDQQRASLVERLQKKPQQ
jgi:antitoxin ParD1/3/4